MYRLTGANCLRHSSTKLCSIASFLLCSQLLPVRMLKRANKIKNLIIDSAGVGSTMTTGNSARKCFFDAKNRQVQNDYVPHKVQSDGECDRKVFD